MNGEGALRGEPGGEAAAQPEVGLPRLWLLGCSLPVLVSGLGLLVALGWWTLNGLSARPERIFAATFAGAPSAESHLRGGGVSWLGHDAWIRFDSPAEPALKDRDRWSPVDPREAVAFFLGVCPEDRASLEDGANLLSLARSDPSKGIANGKWLLWNRRTGATFLRTWAHS